LTPTNPFPKTITQPLVTHSEMTTSDFKPLQHDHVVPTDRRFLNKPMATDSQLDAVGVSSDWREWVRVFDTYTVPVLDSDHVHTYALLHYITTVTDSGKVDEEPMKHIGHVRGIVLHQTTKRDSMGQDKWEVVCQSFPYTPEVVLGPTTQELPNPDTHVFFPSHEGTIFRLWHDHERWILSTHRKIDADRSRWSGPTFGDIFRELFTADPSSLNPSVCYSFIAIHAGNRFVYPVTENKLVPVAEYDRSTYKFRITQKHPLESGQNLSAVVGEMCLKQNPELAGVIAFHKDSQKPVKVISQQYYDRRMIRGNEASIRTRYVQLRNTPQQALLAEWYPEHFKTFSDVEIEIVCLCNYLHGEYMKRFVQKVPRESLERLSKEYHVFIMKCHNWHCENRQRNIVRPEQVEKFLRATETHYLLKMLKEFRNTRNMMNAQRM